MKLLLPLFLWASLTPWQGGADAALRAAEWEEPRFLQDPKGEDCEVEKYICPPGKSEKKTNYAVCIEKASKKGTKIETQCLEGQAASKKSKKADLHDGVTFGKKGKYEVANCGCCSLQDEPDRPSFCPSDFQKVEKVKECSSGEIALKDTWIGSGGTITGRLEVCMDSRWGTVCDEDFHFDDDDARVVCVDLGYSPAGHHKAVPSYAIPDGSEETPIWMDSVKCTGFETALRMCEGNEDEEISDSCDHSNDVGVECDTRRVCSDGRLRIRDRTDVENAVAGRLEVCMDGQWGTICSDVWWNKNDRGAEVACGQMGYRQYFQTGKDPKARHAFNTGRHHSSYGEHKAGTGPVWMSEVQCDPEGDDWLVDCDYNPNKVCYHESDAGVSCINDCFDGDLRLLEYDIGDSDTIAGILEVCKDNKWGTIIETDFDDHDAALACKDLGYSGHLEDSDKVNGLRYLVGDLWDDHQPIHRINTKEQNCSDSADKLAECLIYGGHSYGEDYYDDDDHEANPHMYDVGVRCNI